MKLRTKVILLASALICATIADVSGNVARTPDEVPYSEFVSDWKSGLVDEVYYNSSGMFRYNLKTEEHEALTLKEKHKLDYSEFEWKRTIYPEYEDFIKELVESGVYVYQKDFTPISITLWGMGFMGLFYGALVYFLYRMVTVTDMNKNPLVTSVPNNVKFDNIIGHDEILTDFKFLTEFMKNPELGKKIGADIPKGILLTGPPGTGKTMLAKAVASEASVPFYQVSGSDFIEVYVGTGAKRVRQLFDEARKHQPCIIFIDELDAIGGQRGKQMGDTSEHRQTMNQLLKEMDGFDSTSGILVIGATNFPDELDEALVRAGRFDKRIDIQPPRTDEVRKQLFKEYLKNKTVIDGLDLDNLAKQTQGLTGADIKQICNESAIIALTEGKKEIDFDALTDAIDKRLTHGNKSSAKRSKREMDIVRYHESGHAIVRYILDEEIIRMTINATTSGVGGFVMGTAEENLVSKESIEHDIMILYGGRCSEEIKFGNENITTGALADINQATDLLFKYSNVLSFSDTTPLVNYSILTNGDKALDINTMNAIAKKLEFYTKSLLKNNYHLVEKLASALEEKASLTGKEIKNILSSETITYTLTDARKDWEKFN